MRRRVIQFSVLLVIGAIINVAVAWVCAGWDRPDGGIRPLSTGTPLSPAEIRQLMAAQSVSDWQLHLKIVGMRTSVFGLSRIELFNSPGPFSYPDPFFVRTSAGWPFKIATGDWAREYSSKGFGTSFGMSVSTKTTASIEFGDRLLPFGPSWTGLVMNTLMYAALTWLLLQSPLLLTVRRRLRTRRGLCWNCAYDQSGGPHAICPECGEGALKRS